jgi:hypothetical protein
MADELVRLHLISVPLTQQAIDLLQAQVDDLGGTIIEEVTTDKADEWDASIIFEDDAERFNRQNP